MSDVETQVLIVGGGGAGLTASMLLSKLGVRSLLVNRLSETSILPKAHVIGADGGRMVADVSGSISPVCGT